MSETQNLEELVIDESNFDQYFFDVRKHKPQKGQVMAKYTACAELVDGRLKRDLIDLLLYHKEGGGAASKVMRKLGGSNDRDAYRITREMAEDLVAGMTVDQVAEKPYSFILEHFFYTQKELVPKDDPHWSTIEILNFVEAEQPKALEAPAECSEESPGQDS